MRNAGISIGAVGGVVFDHAGDRAKGILLRLHTDAAAVEASVREAATTVAGKGSRLTMRLFYSGDPTSLASIEVPWGEAALRCEAIIPLVNGGPPITLAYFGGNVPKRISSPATVAAEHELLRGVLARPRRLKELPEGFRVEFLGSDAPAADIEALCRIYALSYSGYMVSFTPEAIREMLGANLAAVCRDESGRIVAISQAEAVTLPIDGHEWRLVELSETATDPDYLRRGLSQLCKVKLIEAMREAHTLIYAESRANHAAVLAANHQLGMVPAGRLEQHCRISSELEDVPQESPWGNLFVFYLPPV